MSFRGFTGVLLKRRRSVILIFSGVLILFFVIFLLMPRTYESVSLIQLGSIGGEIYSTAEAKNIIQGSVILKPIIEEFYSDEKVDITRFNRNNLEVEIVSERIAFGEVEKTEYLRIKTKANSAEKAREINEKILENFLNYVKPLYDKIELTLATDLEQTNQGITNLKNDIVIYEKEINALESRQLDSEGISKSTLLKTILADYKNRLRIEEIRAISLQEKVDRSREFKVVSEPQNPLSPSSPKIISYLFIGIIFGLVLFSVYLFFKERE